MLLKKHRNLYNFDFFNKEKAQASYYTCSKNTNIIFTSTELQLVYLLFFQGLIRTVLASNCTPESPASGDITTTPPSLCSQKQSSAPFG